MLAFGEPFALEDPVRLRHLATLTLAAAVAACSGSDDDDRGGPPREAEPNGTIQTANGPFSGDTLVAGAISTTGDYDYFALANGTATPQLVYVETFEDGVGSCPNADSTLYLYDAAGAYLTNNDDGGVGWCSLLSYQIPPYTTYYVRVGGFGGDTLPYLLAIDFP